MKNILFFLLFALAIVGCKPIIQSSSSSSNGFSNGYYYLPTTLVKCLVSQDENGVIKVAIKPKIVADMRQQYYLKYKQYANANDNLKLEFDENNLLKSVDLIADDQTDEIIVKLAEGIKDIVPGSTTELVAQQMIDSFYFSPFIAADIDTANSILQKYGLSVAIQDIYASASSLPVPRPAADTININGIYYRPYIPLRLKVQSSDNSYSNETVLHLPDPSQVAQFELKRSWLVKKTNKVIFENGNIDNYEIDKPSQTLAFIAIPIELAKAVLSIPATIFQFKIDITTKNKELLEVKNELKELKEELQESEDDTTGDPLD